MKKIIFTPIFKVEKKYYPEPSIKNIPDWYKKTDPFFNSKKFKIINGHPNQTIKKCMPVFDAMTAGYTIKTHCDVNVSIAENGLQEFQWPTPTNSIAFHKQQEALNHPVFNGRPYPKWMSPWVIKTDPGYSCLFIDPMHNPNNIFTIIPGIVDTDEYVTAVNFPFVMNNVDFEGIIPAGTNICQVIPFKRDTFEMKLGNKKQLKQINNFRDIYFIKLVNNYKSRFWHKKEYR